MTAPTHSRATFVDRPTRVTSEQPLSLGELLEGRRVRFGMSILELSNRTRIRTNFLEALEQNDLERLPERLLVKGYLKVLALELDMDEIRLAKALNTVWPLEHVMWKPKPRFEFPWWLLGSAFAGLCSLSLVGWGVLKSVQAGSSVTVAQKENQIVKTALPKPLNFSLSTYPGGAKVYVDGHLLGLSPIVDFPLTERSNGFLKVVRDGYQPFTVQLELNRPRVLKFNLEPISQKIP